MPSPLRRRDFVRLLATGSAAAFAFPRVLSAQTLGLSGVSPSNTLQLGIIGTGSKGTGTMRGLLGRAGVRVVAVCDVDRKRRLEAKSIVDAHYKDTACTEHNDHRELLARPDIDAVWIASADHWHAIQTVDAALAGKHIYVEKPVSSSVAEGRAMVDAVRRAGVVCQVGSQQRSSGEFRRLIEIVRGGYIGRVRRVLVGLPSGNNWNDPTPFEEEPVPDGFDYERWLGPAPLVPYAKERCHYNWRWSMDYNGGQLTDWIGHHYDIATLAMGVSDQQPVLIRDAYAEFPIAHPLFDTAHTYSFDAVYAEGTAISVSSKHPGGIRVEGERGWVFANRNTIDYSSDTLRNLRAPSHLTHALRSPRDHYDAFFDAVRSGLEPNCPIEDGHNIATVAHLATAAFRANRSALRWDPVGERPVDAPDLERFLVRPMRAPYRLPT